MFGDIYTPDTSAHLPQQVLLLPHPIPAMHFSFLQAQIHILKPKMILCMGKIAIEKLMNQSISITQSHGQFFEYNNIPVMPTYHPSALLRNTDLKRPAWEDLKKFKAKLEEFI